MSTVTIPLVGHTASTVDCVHFRASELACQHSAASEQPACRQRCVLTWQDPRIKGCTTRQPHPTYQQRLT